MRLISYARTLFIAMLMHGIWLQGFAQAEEPAAGVINGRVTDAATRLPVEGISISVPGFSSTFSDSIGYFSLQVPGDEVVIMVSGRDYQPKVMPVKGQTTVNILLFEENYSSYYKNANQYYDIIPEWHSTQSVTSLNTREKSRMNTGLSAEEMFRDQVPGLRTITASGVRGSGADMFIRGFSSLYATNQPLIILDGFILETKQYGQPLINGYLSNPLSSINVRDIENITVVRDAASIYGAKAANGVIFIQTTTPTELETKIDFSMYGGLNLEPPQMPLLKADDYRIYLAEILQTVPLSSDSILSLPYMNDDPGYSDYYRYHNDMNWQKEVFRNSYNQNVGLKISGGDDIALYALSVGYTRHEGIIKNTDLSRYTFRFNSDINISPRLTMFTNLGFTFNQNNLKEDGDAPKTNPLHLSLIKSPFTYPNVISPTGAVSPNLEDEDIFGVSNPTAVVRNLTATSNNYKIIGSVSARYKVSDHLFVHNLLGINFDKLRDNIFVPHLGIAGDTLTKAVAENRMGHKVERYLNVNNDARISFTRSLGWNHHLNALAGMRIGMNTSQGDWGLDYNSPNDQMRSLGSGVSSLRQVDGYFGDWNYMTWYLKADYNYKYKYFLSLNLALDGSSRFGEEAKGLSLLSGTFGVFPSISGAWLLSSEPFFNKVAGLDMLKLRASFGITGNDDIGNYSARKYYISQNFLGSQGLVKGNLWNPELQWESNRKFNTGVDAAFLKERLFLQLDFFHNTTANMLNIMEAHPLSGFDYYIENDGSFSSAGLEASINARLLNNHSLKWDVGLILSRYKTKVLSFPGNERITGTYGATILTRTGEPVNLFYGYKTLGVFATQAEAAASGLRALMPNTDLVPFSAGDVHFQDIDGNDIIDENDRQIIGDPNPDLTGLLSNRITWKNLVVDMGISFTVGNDVYNHLRFRLESMQNADNQTPAVLSRWRQEGQVTDVPAARWGDPIGNARFSDRWIEDGSFLRLKYVTLSYTLPLKTRFINTLEMFVRGYNLLTLTGYLGMDPEFSLGDSPLVQGIDFGLTPQPRSFFFGFNVGL